MGNSRPEKGKAAPLSDDDEEEEDPRVLLERLYRTRLELQRMLALSAEADETICMLAAAARRVKQERDEAYMRRNALMAELQARKNARAMVAALASGPPRAVFSPSSRYGRGRALVVPAPALFRRVTTQEQYYAQVAGVSYCYASSSSSTSGHGAFDPNMFLVDQAAEGGSVAPAKTTATGSGAPGMAGKKKKSSGGELGLVAEQILRLSRKEAEVVEADDGTSAEEAAADSESTEDEVGGSVGEKEECCSGGGSSSLDDVVSSAVKKRGDDS